MFAPILLVCILGTETCQLMQRVDNKKYPTFEHCVEATAHDAKNVFEYFLSKGTLTSVSFKCEEDKNSV
jgi:hypothetical protein